MIEAGHDRVRPLPQLTTLNREFWTGGATGTLRIQRCDSCPRYVHPPALLCPDDYTPLTFVGVSGRGKVETWTENLHPWFPNFPAPYFIAYVVLEEDPRTRVLTNLVNVDRQDLRVGLPVKVTFERCEIDDEVIYVPLFEPDVPA